MGILWVARSREALAIRGAPGISGMVLAGRGMQARGTAEMVGWEGESGRMTRVGRAVRLGRVVQVGKATGLGRAMGPGRAAWLGRATGLGSGR
ncbi:hypothetical protein ACQP2U_34760 [Nocardia sp. CA-084685]|uniref:hypothetical protein n=1 Tax=Nocardia sp. CA-084685 TaxID=3239970 RepID=UPI003D99DE43